MCKFDWNLREFYDKTNPLNESKNDFNDNDMGPADTSSVSLIAAS